MKIDKKLVKIMKNIFHQSIRQKTDISDVPNWNSRTHLKLIYEIEKYYNIKFNLNRIPYLLCIERIQEEINRMKMEKKND